MNPPKLPDWFLIAKNYPGLRFGPTVPFLLAAVYHPDGKSPESPAAARSELHALLQKMTSEVVQGYGAWIRFCAIDGLDAHVVGLLEGGAVKKPLDWEPIPPHDTHDLPSLEEALWQEYGQPIINGLYSKAKQGGDWQRLSSPEIAAIASTLASG